MARNGHSIYEPCPKAVLPGDGDLMADFLTRLAGRTMGLAPTVQPLLAPMYAAQPVSVDNGFTSLTEEVSGNSSRQEQVPASLVRNMQVEHDAFREPAYPETTSLATDLPFQPLPEMTQIPQERLPFITPQPVAETFARPSVLRVHSPLGETIDSSIAEQRHGTDHRPVFIKDVGEAIE